ncbi:unnamed protein product [Didymodactylos carnosus]|uniref:Phosphatidylinositol-4-phosphate 3-kinase n=1 Tax=Didymodactylos carnosus TaxID=1234261 RepID=A0A8S2CQ97_9BILA|nr:unnamed protein product [Didymodactylos carnosus]CAF3492530.1 unnamed protein product [Didymodactylos carnosus]
MASSELSDGLLRSDLSTPEKLNGIPSPSSSSNTFHSLSTQAQIWALYGQRQQQPFVNYNQCPTPFPPPTSKPPKTITFQPPEQDTLDKNYFETFDIDNKAQSPQKEKTNDEIPSFGLQPPPTVTTRNNNSPDLIDMNMDVNNNNKNDLSKANIIEFFDPVKRLQRNLDQTSRPHSWPYNLTQAGSPKTETPTISPVTSEQRKIEKEHFVEKTSSPTSPPIRLSNPNYYPYPIRLKFELSTFDEIKAFSDLVQKIKSERSDNQQKQPSFDQSKDDLFYCERVNRLTPQHLEQKHSIVTIQIYANGSKEPLRLNNISLMSTVEHLLYQLLELIQFDLPNALLKLRNREEYLRNEDVLCDIEYVYNCLQSLQPLQFVLTERPPYCNQTPQTTISSKSFEQFCIEQQDEHYRHSYDNLQTSSSSTSTGLSRTLSTRYPTMTNQPNLARSSHAPFLASDPLWLKAFKQDIDFILKQVEQRINKLLSFLLDQNTTNNLEVEQRKIINELFGFIKNIQVTCSYIESFLIVEKQRELRLYIDKITRQSLSKEISSELSSASNNKELIRLLYELVVTLVNYVRTYCNSYLIPYKLYLNDEQNNDINIEQLAIALQKQDQSYLNVEQKVKRPITESSESFRVYIDGLFCLAGDNWPQYKSLRVVCRLCYGNRTKSRQITDLMSIKIQPKYPLLSSSTNSHMSASLKPQVLFDQWLSFHDAQLCELPREAVLMFEIFALEKTDVNSSGNGLPVTQHYQSLTMMTDGSQMKLIGWCSQSLFDDKNCLIQGEKYLGVFSSETSMPTGFYSLRNVYDRDCPILSVTFLMENSIMYRWPDIKPRGDMKIENFTKLDHTKQEKLSKLLKTPSLLINDHKSMYIINNGDIQYKKSPELQQRQQSKERAIAFNYETDFSDDEAHLIWSCRHCLIQQSYALPKILSSRHVWDYPSLIDIYGVLEEVKRDHPIDLLESFELLLPSFPDMSVRQFAYKSLFSNLNDYNLSLYLPQLLQIIKYDYLLCFGDNSSVQEYLLKSSLNDPRLLHKLYWQLQQLLVYEKVHYLKYYYFLMSLLYLIDDKFRLELKREYEMCTILKQIAFNLKHKKNAQRTLFLHEQLKIFDEQFFQNGKQPCRLPCQFNFMSNGLDIQSCTYFKSLTSPLKLVFNPIDSACDKYYSIYKNGDDLRQDQIVILLLNCMDYLWKQNDYDFRLILFNVVQTSNRCGFIEMVTECETLREIESKNGVVKGAFKDESLADWLKLHNPTDIEYKKAVENFTYSCAGYCVATFILGIGDRHNDNIMLKQSGHLFHIDFGKYLGDTQKFGSFNRDRAPFIFTKNMCYVINGGEVSGQSFHRFVDLCCDAFSIIRQNRNLLLLLLTHLCDSNIPGLTYDAVRFVYDRLLPTISNVESITQFTHFLTESLNNSWTQINFAIHSIAQGNLGNTNTPSSAGHSLLSFVPKTFTIATDGRVKSAQVVGYEKRSRPVKHYIYKIKVERIHTDNLTSTKNQQITYVYRTAMEFFEFHEKLTKQFPLIGVELKFAHRNEYKTVAQTRVVHLNTYLTSLFNLASEIVESDLVCTFFHTIARDQQATELRPKSNDSTTHAYDLQASQAKIKIHLKYEEGKLFISIRYASNLPLRGGALPNPYCKCYLFPDADKSTKRKGKIVLGSKNPTFNDMFTYEMPLHEIQRRVLRVSVWNSGLLPTNDNLGEVDIVLSKIDWSKENARDYVFNTPEAWIDT